MLNLSLFDDGAHGDGTANDGLYGNRFTSTFTAGSYVVRVTAAGTSNIGSPFVRRITRAFDLAQDEDKDQDGLPDAWEEENGTDPFTNDAQQDPDLDMLVNSGEFQNGTHPLDPDTDDGGEGDGSEVFGQKDPLDPDDDGIKTHGDLYVQPGINFNVLTLPFVPGIVNWQLYVSTDPEQGYQPSNAQLPLSGYYTDTQLTNGMTYFYRLVGFDALGQAGLPSYPVSATPKTDPFPPSGSVLINGGAQLTSSTAVMLTIRAADDAPPHTPNDRVATLFEDSLSDGTAGLEMRIANEPTFTGANWEPYAATKDWQLDGLGGPALVYIQFRDEAGNELVIASDYIDTGKLLFLPVISQ